MTSNNQASSSNLKDIEQDDTINPESSASKISTPSATTPDIPEFGWSGYAERINGRFAMLGFIAILVVEGLTHDAFLNWAGFLP